MAPNRRRDAPQARRRRPESPITAKIFRAAFDDGGRVRVAAEDEAAAELRVRLLYGPGTFTLTPEKLADVTEVLPPPRRRSSERGSL